MSSNIAPRKKQQELEKAFNSDITSVNIRLRQGEYQFDLAKTIASFELELNFPNVKDLVKKLYGEKRAEDPKFVSKIQTVLKKMEKMGVIRILPKEKPWELQRYALTSFQFLDVEKNQVVLAPKAEIEKTIALIRSQQNQKPLRIQSQKGMAYRISLLVSIIIASFALILWALSQPTLNLTLFISAFLVAATSSTILGTSIARKHTVNSGHKSEP